MQHPRRSYIVQPEAHPRFGSTTDIGAPPRWCFAGQCFGGNYRYAVALFGTYKYADGCRGERRVMGKRID